MATILLIIHIIVCFFLIAVVLLQSGKGAELGAAFGGSSQTLFGSRGAATFLSKLTTVAAIVFMITSLMLAMITAKGSILIRKTPVSSEKQPIQTPSIPSQLPSTTSQQIPPTENKQGVPAKQSPSPERQIPQQQSTTPQSTSK